MDKAKLAHEEGSSSFSLVPPPQGIINLDFSTIFDTLYLGMLVNNCTK